MRRFPIGAPRVGGALAICVIAAAAVWLATAGAVSLRIVADPISAGSAPVGPPRCTTQTTYTAALRATPAPTWFVDSVTVTAVPTRRFPAGCRGFHVRAALTGRGGAPFPVVLPTLVLNHATPATATWSSLARSGAPISRLTDVMVVVTP